MEKVKEALALACLIVMPVAGYWKMYQLQLVIAIGTFILYSSYQPRWIRVFVRSVCIANIICDLIAIIPS